MNRTKEETAKIAIGDCCKLYCHGVEVDFETRDGESIHYGSGYISKVCSVTIQLEGLSHDAVKGLVDAFKVIGIRGSGG